MTSPSSEYWKCVSRDDLAEEVSFPDNFQYTYDMKERKKIAQEVLAAEVSPDIVLQEFITHLPDNHAIHAGYHIHSKHKVSLCPCSRIVSPWMTEYNIQLEDHEFCTAKKAWNNPYTVLGLKNHLYNQGDSFHKQHTITSQDCIPKITSFQLLMQEVRRYLVRILRPKAAMSELVNT